ncbi:hypothetical protein GGI42DRAFT_203708 [Trichoderma sp. SZMC 28013]
MRSPSRHSIRYGTGGTGPRYHWNLFLYSDERVWYFEQHAPMKCNSVLCMYLQLPEAFQFALNYTYDAMLALPHPLSITCHYCTGSLSSAAATECSVPLRPSHALYSYVFLSPTSTPARIHMPGQMNPPILSEAFHDAPDPQLHLSAPILQGILRAHSHDHGRITMEYMSQVYDK